MSTKYEFRKPVDKSGSLCSCDGKVTQKVKAADKVVGLDRNSGPKNRNESDQMGSLRADHGGGRFKGDGVNQETAGVKGK
jgi:hypothetical protein